jgi:hypothetical protein
MQGFLKLGDPDLASAVFPACAGKEDCLFWCALLLRTNFGSADGIGRVGYRIGIVCFLSTYTMRDSIEHFSALCLHT